MLQRVAGDEEAFVQAGGEQADALYDVQRRMLAGMLAAVRGPSTWAPEEAPATLDERLHALVDEHVPDSDEGRRTALRHQLARRLLDDPVVYSTALDPEARAYFANQRGAMAARLCEAAGLVAEQRAEGLALVDETGALTDVAMPAEGTEAHVDAAGRRASWRAGNAVAGEWRRPARPPGMRGTTSPTSCARPRSATAAIGANRRASPAPKRELAAIAIERLEKLQLVERKAATRAPAAGARPLRARRGRVAAVNRAQRRSRDGDRCSTD